MFLLCNSLRSDNVAFRTEIATFREKSQFLLCLSMSLFSTSSWIGRLWLANSYSSFPTPFWNAFPVHTRFPFLLKTSLSHLAGDLFTKYLLNTPCGLCRFSSNSRIHLFTFTACNLLRRTDLEFSPPKCKKDGGRAFLAGAFATRINPLLRIITPSATVSVENARSMLG